MFKGLLIFTLALSFNASYYVAIEDFYVDDVVTYLNALEDECTTVISDAVGVLNTDAAAVYTVDSAYTPAVATGFTKDSFKTFIEIVEEYIENIST